MKRMHVMVKVKGLEESILFYNELFAQEPTVVKADYAKWMLEDPRLNFSIGLASEAPGVEHLGIQAETPEELEELRGRISAAGGTVRHEGQTTCCYHNSDKTWVVDAQGVAWEAFHTSGEAETYHTPQGTSDEACCTTDCCSTPA